MLYGHLRLLRIAIFLLSSAGSVFGDDVPTAGELADRVLANRRAISDGHVVIRSNYVERGTTLPSEWEVYFDGDKIRGDLRRKYGTKPPGAASEWYTEVSCHGCYKDSMLLTCTDKNSPDGQRFVAMVSDPGTQDPTLVFVPDPRWLGLFPLSVMLMRHFNMEHFVGSKPWRTGEVTAAESDGSATWNVEYTTDDGTRVTAVLSKLDENIREIREEFIQGGIQYQDRVTCEYDADVPISKHMEYRRHERKLGEDGEWTETMREDVDVKIVSLNEGLDPVVFSPKGISALQKGTYLSWASVREPPRREQLVWDGTDFKPENQLQPPASPRRWLRWGLMAAGAACLALAYRLIIQHRAAA